MHVLAISRALCYSPLRHAENDRLILEETVKALRSSGATISWMAEERLGAELPPADLVLSMCQGLEGTTLLKAHEARGAMIVNSPTAVSRCYRANLFRLLAQTRHEFPDTLVIDTANPPRKLADPMSGSFWIKRGDVHAVGPGDVIRVENPNELGEVLSRFHARGIGEAIVQRHVPGLVVKFYGVAKTGFFRYYAERDRELCPAEVARARPQIEALVEGVGLSVYGGDCVVRADGGVTLIDLNDWPSFAYFRGEAAEAIAQRMLEFVHAKRALKMVAADRIAVLGRAFYDRVARRG